MDSCIYFSYSIEFLFILKRKKKDETMLSFCGFEWRGKEKKRIDDNTNITRILFLMTAVGKRSREYLLHNSYHTMARRNDKTHTNGFQNLCAFFLLVEEERSAWKISRARIGRLFSSWSKDSTDAFWLSSGCCWCWMEEDGFRESWAQKSLTRVAYLYPFDATLRDVVRQFLLPK